MAILDYRTAIAQLLLIRLNAEAIRRAQETIMFGRMMMRAGVSPTLEQIRSQIVATQAATREAVEAISAIGTTIRTLDEASSAIAAAVEEQSAVTREMSGSMQAAAQGTVGIAAGVEAIARASGRVDEATRQVREAARAVA